MSRPICILHIGMPKTGSSSIQDTLYNNSDYLEDCEYLKLGNSPNHSVIIYSLFSSNPHLHHAHVSRGFSEKDIEKYNNFNLDFIRDRAVNTKKGKLIISGEDIVFLDNSELEKLKKVFSDIFSDIFIIGYVRPPISFMQSAFQQNVKTGDLRFGISGYYPNYKEKFEKFDKIFGEKNVNLIKYDKKSLYKNDVVLDFCDKIKVEINHNSIIISNKSLSLEAISIIYFYHKLNRQNNITDSENNYNIVNLFEGFGKRKFQYSKCLIAEIQNFISKDVAWMENRLELPLGENFAPHDYDVESEKDLISIAKKYFPDFVNCFLRKNINENIYNDFFSKIINDFIGNKELCVVENKQMHILESPSSCRDEIIKEIVLMMARCNYTQAAKNINHKLSDSFNTVFFKLIYKMYEFSKNLYCILFHKNQKNTIKLSVDYYDDATIKGWAFWDKNPNKKLYLKIYQKRCLIAEGHANKYRNDLVKSGIGDGFCFFDFNLRIKIDKSKGFLLIKIKNPYSKIFYNLT